jgi:Succinylglutamate desuccinylase / Aspartoacylase family
MSDATKSDLKFEFPAPDLAAWREGNTGTPGVWQFDSGVPGRRVLLSALVHGNKLSGAWALKELLEAGVRPQQGTLTLAFCNLDAFDRFDPDNHDASRLVEEDLNRQWQPSAWRRGARWRRDAPRHCARSSSRPTGCSICIPCTSRLRPS